MNEVNVKNVGAVVSERRKELGMSTQELADLSGILDPNMISALENGKSQYGGSSGHNDELSETTLQSVATSLGLDMESMLIGVLKPKPKRETLTKALNRIDISIQSLNDERSDLLHKIANLGNSRFEVRTYNKSAEPAYSIFDNDRQCFLSNKDGNVLLFRDTGTAFRWCDSFNCVPEHLDEQIDDYVKECENDKDFIHFLRLKEMTWYCLYDFDSGVLNMDRGSFSYDETEKIVADYGSPSVGIAKVTGYAEKKGDELEYSSVEKLYPPDKIHKNITEERSVSEDEGKAADEDTNKNKAFTM